VELSLFTVSAYPADLFGGSSLGLGYHLGAAAAAAAAAASPWRQLYTPASPAAERRYLNSPMQPTISPHHLHHHHQQQQPVWSPTSAFTHPAAAAAAAAGLTEGTTRYLSH